MGPLLRSIPALLIALGATASAFAGDVPDPSMSTLPAGVALVGDVAGVADPAGTFSVIVRFLSGSPVPGADVVVEFTNCATDIRVCAGGPPGAVDCPSLTVHATSDASGFAQFDIRGSARFAPATIRGGCARIYADGVVLGIRPVAAYDLSGSGGLGPPDISQWLADYFRSVTEAFHAARSDYDFNGVLSPVDLATFLKVSFAGQSFSSCSSPCN